MDELFPITDIATEGLVLGCLYKNADLLTEYEDLIFPEYDFYNEDIRFLYNLLREIWHNGNTRIDETTVNIAVSKSSDKAERLKKIRGFPTIQKLMDKVNLDDFNTYYTDMKKYNLLRALDKQGFPIKQRWDKISKLNPEAIYKYFDHGLSKTFTYYEGVSGSTILGKNMLERYEKWKKEPDIGIELPFYILNSAIRGWRTGKLNSTGLHSGCGKSRIMVNIAMHIGIVQQIPLLIIVNEQDEEEWASMLLCAVVNNLYGPSSGIYIDEEKIITGQCSPEEDAICKKAAEMIERRSKIHFQEAVIYDYKTLKRVLKVHKLRGVNHFILDTFKPFRGESGASWEAFVKTSEELKKICGSKKKGGLDMGGWLTFQLTDDSLFDKILTSTSVASGKQIKHNLDNMGLYRELSYTEKQSIQCSVYEKNNPFNGKVIDLDPRKMYYIMFNDKNRGGKDKQKIILEVDKGKLIFKEIGFAKFKKQEDEDMLEKRPKSNSSFKVRH